MGGRRRVARATTLILALIAASLLGCTTQSSAPSPTLVAASASPRLIATSGPPASPSPPPDTPATPRPIPATPAQVATPCVTPSIATARSTPLNLPQVPEPDAYLTTALTNGDVLMFSANRHNTHFGGIAFVYNPTTDTYVEIPLPPREGRFDWLFPLQDGRAIAGAVGTYAGRDILSVSTFDPATRRFGPIIDLKLPGYQEFDEPSRAVQLTNGDILLLDPRRVWRFQPDQQKVTLTAPKRTGANRALVALPDGRALALSGSGPGVASDVPFVSAEGEIYDPQRDEWRAIAPIPPVPRSGFVAMVLDDGRVMVAGGVRRVPPGRRAGGQI